MISPTVRRLVSHGVPNGSTSEAISKPLYEGIHPLARHYSKLIQFVNGCRNKVAPVKILLASRLLGKSFNRLLTLIWKERTDRFSFRIDYPPSDEFSPWQLVLEEAHHPPARLKAGSLLRAQKKART